MWEDIKKTSGRRGYINVIKDIYDEGKGSEASIEKGHKTALTLWLGNYESQETGHSSNDTYVQGYKLK